MAMRIKPFWRRPESFFEDRRRLYREFLKTPFAEFPEMTSDERRGAPAPPLAKPAEEGKVARALPDPSSAILLERDIETCLRNRRSRRDFSHAPISLPSLSFLLWASHGVLEVIDGGRSTHRTVASSGARHPYETCFFTPRVEGLERGLWRYLPLSHEVQFLRPISDLEASLRAGGLGQEHVGRGALVFAWTCIPRRAEWRYNMAAHKPMLIDLGCICQNLYLAGEALGVGVCSIGGYDQPRMDALLGLDGEEEFVVHMATVGPLAED